MTCKVCQVPFEVTVQEKAFLEQVSPMIDGKKFLLPVPQLCPSCRRRRRFSFRNQNFVYTRDSSKSGIRIYSMYSSEAPFPVYHNDEWWEQSWDARDFGREFDFSKTFFEQFAELRNSVPHMARQAVDLSSSDYCNNVVEMRDSYLCFDSADVSESLYLEGARTVERSIDCSRIYKCRDCYDCVECSQCSHLQSSFQCRDCHLSYFLNHCEGCRNCFSCSNLRNREYCILNKQYTPEAYRKYLTQIKFDSFRSRRQLAEQAEAFSRWCPMPHMIGRGNQHSTGNCLFDCENVTESFFVRDGKNLRYCDFVAADVNDCQNVSFLGRGLRESYENVSCGINSVNLLFCYECWDSCSELLYCAHCPSSRYLFGCVGLKKAEFCVLNKSYGKDEYRKLVARILTHMQETGEYGEFYPMNLSPFAYNHSLASRYFPESREQVVSSGGSWSSEELVSSQQAVLAAKLPDLLEETQRTLFVRSERSGEVFRITTDEVALYKKFGAPFPRVAYYERMDDRMKKLGVFRLYERKCPKTGNELLSSYDPKSPWTVWDAVEFEKSEWPTES